MKKHYLLASLLLCSSLYAENVEVKKFIHAGPISIASPIMTDSLNVQGKKLNAEEMLKTSISFAQALKSS